MTCNATWHTVVRRRAAKHIFLSSSRRMPARFGAAFKCKSRGLERQSITIIPAMR